MAKKTKSKAEFGDFQTPPELAIEVCGKLADFIGSPATIVEPTCGVGNFIVAATQQFGSEPRVVGIELNGSYVETARQALLASGRSSNATVMHHDFFALDWTTFLSKVELPLLVVGNPPWVTNSELGSLGSTNLPAKTNFQNLKGLDALTGRSNFDISEWMGIRLLEQLRGVDATVAILIKVSVARKLLLHAWTSDLSIRDPKMYRIDAKKHFGASVDACLFMCRTDRSGEQRCPVYASIQGNDLEGAVGIDENGTLVANIDARHRTAHLLGADSLEWRSGVKHDCSKVLELRRVSDGFVNGLGESVEVEAEMLYPLMKSSHVAKSKLDSQRWLIVPQRATGEDTRHLRATAPLTWAYLKRHEELLNGRKSSIYRNRPQFSIFGVGEYTFTQWKIAISGLYKKLEFLLVPPLEGRPVVFDDTVYVTPCSSEADARTKLKLLNSLAARDFYSSFIFWDAKRPITAKVLRQLDFYALATAVGAAGVCDEWAEEKSSDRQGTLRLGREQIATAETTKRAGTSGSR